MAQEIVSFNPGFINMLQEAFTGNRLPMPYVHNIFLMDCHIAGTTFRDNLDDIEPELKEKDVLVFKREPDNKHDRLAVMVLDAQGRLLGYVPRYKNEVIARLMDAGKTVFATIERKTWRGSWLKIDLKVHMREL